MSTLLTKVDEDRLQAERRHEAALRVYREARRRQSLLEGQGVLLDANGKEHAINDAIERDILSGELAREREAAAIALRDAREDYLAAKIASVSEKLPALLAEYDEVQSEIEGAVHGFEAAYANLIAASWNLGEALAPETTITRGVYRLAVDIIDGDDERERLKHEMAHRLPVAFDDAGRPREWRERVRGHVFGAGSGSDPAGPELWFNLGEACRRSPEKGLRELGKNVRARVLRVIEQRENRGSK